MAALDDAEAGAAEQYQDGGGEAGAARNVAFEQRDQAVRIFLAFQRAPGPNPVQAQPRAQPRDRAIGGGFEVRFGPRRPQRSSEASSTIHCTSSSNVARKRLRVLAQVTSRSCRT